MNQEVYHSPESEQALRRKRISEGLKRTMAEEFKTFAIESIVGSMCSNSRIERIEARIHKIELFGADRTPGAYNWDQVHSQFKDAKFYPNRGSLYKDFYLVTLKGFEKVYVERGLVPERFGQPCNVRIVPEDSLPTQDHHQWLAVFDKSFPDLKPRLVEYTLDLFCKDANHIVLIYHFLRKYIFVKGIKDTWTEVGPNLTTYWKNTQKQLMVYQRGKTKDSEKLDRVRIELTVSRDLLRKRGILTLEDMIRDIKFSKTWDGVMNFEHFMTPDMPEDHSYIAQDKHGNFDAFQLEYLEKYKSQKDMSKCMESLKELDSFKDRLSNVVRKFDAGWKWPEYSRISTHTERGHKKGFR